jgi:hypothetical protein
MEKPNRAERRKHKFGGGRSTEHGGWPTIKPNPVFGAPDASDEEPAGDAQGAASGDGPATDPAAGPPGDDVARAGNGNKG